MKIAAAVATGAWLGASLPAWRRYLRALATPQAAQDNNLRRILASNARSAYGRANEFGKLRNAAEFRERVPIVDYRDLAPWIERIIAGETSVLTCEPVTRLVPTSGSTTGRKLIPYTPSFQRELNAAISPWIVDLCRAHPGMALGPAYWSISPALPASASEHSAVPIGFEDDSAYLGGFQQRLAEATFAVPSIIRQVRDLECARYLTLLCLLREPELRLISIWHPSFLALLLNALPLWWDELISDIARGGSRHLDSLPSSVRQTLAAPPQPRRATKLRELAAPEPRVIWPHLQVVSCWGDGQATVPFANLATRLPGTHCQSKGLLATEAFVSIPFQGRHPLAITSHYLEFEDARGNMRTAGDLQAGQPYGVIVTTAGGLYRYRLGDLVEVDGFVGRTPSVRFLGRGERTSDLCGEKLTEAFVTRVLDAICYNCAFAPAFAMLAPSRGAGESWAYRLYVEGQPPDRFADHLEVALRENPHYALCRDLGQLGATACVALKPGAYDAFCTALEANGQRRGDIKPQTLSPRSDWHEHFAHLR